VASLAAGAHPPGLTRCAQLAAPPGADGHYEGLEVRTLLPALVTVVGVMLMVAHINADSEPGAIPLILILIGIGWLFVSRTRKRRHYT
jgi:hypothetical protein